MYLSYHYEPDLSAGSFRNTALSKELSERLGNSAIIHLICSQPNRYQSVTERRPPVLKIGNLIIYSIEVPQHGNKYFGQLISFYHYQKNVREIIKDIDFKFVFASTSKLFTGYIAYKIAVKRKCDYYLDVRDLFAENLKELVKIPFVNHLASWFVKLVFERPAFIHAKHININSEGFRNTLPAEYKGSISFFPNGIDDEFNQWKQSENISNNIKIICYAGNIGEGQGLDKIIPDLAKALESTHRFVIIGEGATRLKLEKRIYDLKLQNVKLFSPMKRSELLKYYQNSHYLFLHLNDFRSFEKVLPSKIFEYGAGNIPILAGVKGYAADFIENELKDNAFVFRPCDVNAVKDIILEHKYYLQERNEFIKKYNRKSITSKMADSIIHIMNGSDEKP